MTKTTATPDRSTTTTPPLTFESPDGRVWQRDVDHHHAPRSRMGQVCFTDAFEQGLATAFARLGAPLLGAAACHVHGWFYFRFIPVGAPDRPSPAKTPPAMMVRILSRIHPQLRSRNRTASAAVDNERWLDDVASWWSERADWNRRFRRYQDTELSTLDSEELGALFDTAAADATAMLRRHFELITPGAGIGVALNEAAANGIDAVTAGEALRGCSKATSAPVRDLRAIRDALTLDVLDAASTVEELRATSDEARDLIDAYLAKYGWRVLGDDLPEKTLADRPDVLVRSVRGVAATVDDADPIGALVAGVAPSARAEVERLLRQAGRCYEVLDDNSAVTCWGLGVMRRVGLECAKRLVATGALDDVEQVWVLEPDELSAMVRSRHGVSIDTIRARRAEHVAAESVDAPYTLGGQPAAPPDPGLFPSGLSTVASAIGTYLGLRFPPPTERADTGTVIVDGTTVATGHGIGIGSATGRAVVVSGVNDALDRLEPGDVLVCPCTNPAYNVLFPIAAAVVTEVGGPMGHTAVTAREVGIPAVVGVGHLGAIRDGDRVTVRTSHS